MFGLLQGGTHSLRAATVNWGTPTFLSADSDVSTSGTLVAAYNLGSTGVPSSTVNGVIFAPFAVSNGTTSTTTVSVFSLAPNNANFSDNTSAGFAGSPFSSLSPAYQSLLRSGVSTLSLSGRLTLTMGGLSLGDLYQVEFWSNASTLGFTANNNAQTVIGSGNSVTLDDNSTNSQGGVGQWVTGTFVADSASQVFAFTSSQPASDYPVLNAFELRDLAVPEPSSCALLSLSGLAVAFAARRRRNQAPVTTILP